MFYKPLVIFLPDVKMNTCTICGKQLSRSDNLRRHMRLIHRQTGNEGEQDLPDLKEADGERTEDDSSDSSEDDDELGYSIRHIWHNNYDTFVDKVETYENDGMTTDESKDKANAEMLRHNRKHVIEKYTTLLNKIHGLKRSKIHRDIMEKIKKYRARGLGHMASIRQALHSRKHVFDRYLPEYDTEEEMDID